MNPDWKQPGAISLLDKVVTTRKMCTAEIIGLTYKALFLMNRVASYKLNILAKSKE